jgi:hypothetical protein
VRVKITLVSVVISFVRVKITLRLEGTLVRVEITVVSVVITFVRVKITLRLEITLCVKKSHAACENYTLCLKITLCV